ncbi:NucA/NucB deoxyribonuclease domain-containing protein [Rhodococcus spelaei]|uniref:NucA/NucB deoxyribonuclease domain-containing protein n=1 Tax=Rhodococcus spelaei TaxID=2546320 RepID=UPI001FE69FDD|nr:hypothetical protein [Rhodococcus spelaei]
MIPGKMRSDREEIPGGYTKEQADKAEMKEARTQKQAQQARAGLLAPPPPGCQQYWPTEWNVCGAIRDKYNSLGGPLSFLLLPASHELVNPDGFGRRSVFQNGPIYWSAAGGAHPVVNHFFAAWARKGYEGGYIGYPTTDEIVNPDGIGRRQNFTGATIYWKLNEAYSIGGLIRDKWGQTGWEGPGGLLGYPITDEVVLPDGQGRMNRFERGVIYWHPTFGAHPVTGRILLQWGSEQYEAGIYGYPTADPQQVGTNQTQQFQYGTIGGPQAIARFTATEPEDTPSNVNMPDYVGSNGQYVTTLPANFQTRDCNTAGTGTGSGYAACVTYGAHTTDPTIMMTPGQPPLEEQAPPPVQPFSAPIVTKNWCEKDYDEEAKTGNITNSWIAERTYACSVHPVVLTLKNISTNALLARANAKFVQEVHTKYNDPKQNEYRAMFDIESVFRTLEGANAPFTLSASISCPTSACTAAQQDGMVNENIVPGAQLFVYSKISFGDLAPGALVSGPAEVDWTLSGIPTSPGSNEGVDSTPNIRCDNDTPPPGFAKVIGKGCVFPNRSPIMDVVSDPNQQTIANHIKRAQQSGLRGAETLYATGPLNRMADKNERIKNRNRACPGTANKYDTAGGTKSCDEYPFASTKQGAAQPSDIVQPPNGRTFSGCGVNDLPRVDPSRTGSSGYSVCMVPVGEQSKQANAIGSFYYQNRLLDGEAFFVRADTGN